MKNLFNKAVFVTTLLATSFMAQAKDIITHSFAINGEKQGTVHNIVAIVNDEMEMKLKVTTTTGARYPFYTDGDSYTSTFETKKLSKPLFELLETKAIWLSDAKIEENEIRYICLMIPGPVQSNNHLSVATNYVHETKEFLGKLRLVDGPKGCWVKNMVQPEQKHLQTTAQELKSILKTLALDHAGNELE